MFISEIIDNPSFVFSGKCRILETAANGAKREIWSNAESGDMAPDLLVSLNALEVSAINVNCDGFLEIEYRAKPETEYRAEIEWLYDVTAYEWTGNLSPMTPDDAIVNLDGWKESGLDDIPEAFLAPHGYKLLAELWNKYIA